MAEAERLTPELEERVLLLAPTRRDASAAGRLFAAAGLAVTLCDDLQALCSEAHRGAAAVIVPEEAVQDDVGDCLGRLLADQPPWSDLPVIILTKPRSAVPPGRQAGAEPEPEGGHQPAGNFTLVRRPVEIRALASTVRAALRDRRRQYAMRAALAEREDQARALREADRHKDEFLAMLAHELRNPLAAVNNAVSVLKHSPDEENRAWGTDVVSRQVQHLSRLIDDLLDVSRVTTGKIRLRKEYVDAGPAIDQAVESARPLIQERRHVLTVSVDRGRLPLLADSARVEQVLVNLLTNAAKYTECGGRIWLTAAREGDQVVLRVRDNGLGIPPERLPEMFQLFSQGDRSLDRSQGAWGSACRSSAP
ncbi:MAG: HAMP domain-containing sensor histidine kinase [Isosphaeraceae bacterium]